QNLIGALTSVRNKALQTAGGGGGGARSLVDTTATSVFYVYTSHFIEPGLYRIQKSWERQVAEAGPEPSPECCHGLLTEMGFTTGAVTSVLSAADFAKAVGETPPGG